MSFARALKPSHFRTIAYSTRMDRVRVGFRRLAWRKVNRSAQSYRIKANTQ